MLKDTNWKSFVGQQVEVQKDGEFIRTGFVLDVVDSADILWLEAAGAKQRALFEKAMGYTILPLASPLGQRS